MIGLLAVTKSSHLDPTLRIVAIGNSIFLFALILDLVRRRRLVERYALMWLLVGAALLLLSAWSGLLETVADLIGVGTPSNFLFAAALGATFLLLLHFSVATSRLGEEVKILAQEVARLDQELRAERGEMPAAADPGAQPIRDPPQSAAEQEQDGAPVAG